MYKHNMTLLWTALSFRHGLCLHHHTHLEDVAVFYSAWLQWSLVGGQARERWKSFACISFCAFFPSLDWFREKSSIRYRSNGPVFLSLYF